MGATIAIATGALMLAAFCVCGIPFGYLIAKATSGVDVTTQGSGNIGSTNVARTAGLWQAGLTLLLDVGKGFLSVWAARYVLAALAGGEAPLAPTGELGWAPALVFMAAVAGHIFSPYMGFKGGKGIACGFGACLALCWPVALCILATFVVIAVPTRYVSAGSLAAAIALPIFAAVFYQPIHWGFEVPVALAALMAIWAHHENIAKLAHGNESKFGGPSKPVGPSSVPVGLAATMDAEAEAGARATVDAETPPEAGAGLSFGDEGGEADEISAADAELAELQAQVNELKRELGETGD